MKPILPIKPFKTFTLAQKNRTSTLFHVKRKRTKYVQLAQLEAGGGNGGGSTSSAKLGEKCCNYEGGVGGI